MLEAISYHLLIEDLKRKHGSADKVPIGILIGNAHCDFMKDNILSRINQYHHRSNYNIDFYLPGYGAYWYGNCGPQEVVCTIDKVDWLFSDKLFCEFIAQLESVSKWTYSGETELILLNYSNGNLDFSEVVVFWLDKMVRDGIIYSPASFFENIFMLFKNNATVYEVSDRLATRGIGNSIWKILCEQIPILKLIKNKYFCTRNYSK